MCYLNTESRENEMIITLNELNNPQYNLSAVAQAAFTAHYFNPYPDGQVRSIHGSMHASRVAAYVKVLHLFRQDQNDPALNDLGLFATHWGFSITQLIHLTQIAALFHDSARLDEGVDYWDDQSADNCVQFLRNNISALSEIQARLISNAARHKDHRDQFLSGMQQAGVPSEAANAADYLRQLVHDADSLDIIRVVREFNMHYLDICQNIHFRNDQQKSQLIADLVQQVQLLIQAEGDQLSSCTLRGHLSEIHFSNRSVNRNWNRQLKSQFEGLDGTAHDDRPHVYQNIVDHMTTFPILNLVARPIVSSTRAEPKPTLAPATPISEPRVPIFKGRAAFEEQLEIIKNKAPQLKEEGHDVAANAADVLSVHITEQSRKFFTLEISEQAFKSSCTDAINRARPALEAFGWKEILGNLVLAILGLGVFYAAAGLINYSTKGHFLFFRMDAAQKTDVLEEKISEMTLQ